MEAGAPTILNTDTELGVVLSPSVTVMPVKMSSLDIGPVVLSGRVNW